MTEQLIDKIKRFKTYRLEEEYIKLAFVKFLEKDNAFERSNLEGHITCSSWLVNKDMSKAVLLKHKKLNMWVQPGGHADGDKDTLGVAIKEAREETNIQNIEAITDEIFDLSIHKIPEHKGVPEHLHYDIRYLLRVASDEEGFKSDESDDLIWIDQNVDISKYHYGLVRMIKKWISLTRVNN